MPTSTTKSRKAKVVAPTPAVVRPAVAKPRHRELSPEMKAAKADQMMLLCFLCSSIGQDVDLSKRQMAMLLLLHARLVEPTIRELAVALVMHKSATVRAVDKLVTERLCWRDISNNDKRMVIVRMTALGQDVAVAMQKALRTPTPNLQRLLATQTLAA